MSTLPAIGGMWAFFLFFHFLFDWVFQTHTEAINKSKPGGKLWLARHCATYTLLFVGLFLLLGMSTSAILLSALVLFVSHFIEDTYIPVYLWAKYIRKPTIEVRKHSYMCQPKPDEDCDCDLGLKTVVVDSKQRFKAWLRPRTTNHTIAMILLIGIDQIVHMAFLFVPAYLYVIGV